MFKVTTHDARTIRWWFLRREQIDFAPPFQRKGNLWSMLQKQRLLDSIINEYDIPKIYMADFTIFNSKLNSKKLSYAIIDGRQRMEAINGFFSNQYSLANDFVYYEQPEIDLSGLKYEEIKQRYPDVVDKFEQFNLHIMSVVTDDISRINDLFIRLNSSRPLTGAEVRNAMRGVVPKLTKEITSHVFFTNRVSFATNRGQDTNTAYKLLLVEFRGRLVDTKKVQLDRFVEEGTLAETTDVESAAKRVLTTLDRFAEVFNANDKLLKSQGPIIPYYWLLRGIDDYSRFREFIAYFDKMRLLSKDPSLLPKANYDDMVKYENLNRNTNDQGSLNQRYEILTRYYKDWITGGK